MHPNMMSLEDFVSFVREMCTSQRDRAHVERTIQAFCESKGAATPMYHTTIARHIRVCTEPCHVLDEYTSFLQMHDEKNALRILYSYYQPRQYLLDKINVMEHQLQQVLAQSTIKLHTCMTCQMPEHMCNCDTCFHCGSTICEGQSCQLGMVNGRSFKTRSVVGSCV